jgi:hypothetical protein
VVRSKYTNLTFTTSHSSTLVERGSDSLRGDLVLRFDFWKMADAKARAAARREAILAGRSDRLAKLTTKAKNEGNVAGIVREHTDGQPNCQLYIVAADVCYNTRPPTGRVANKTFVASRKFDARKYAFSAKT